MYVRDRMSLLLRNGLRPPKTLDDIGLSDQMLRSGLFMVLSDSPMFSRAHGKHYTRVIILRDSKDTLYHRRCRHHHYRHHHHIEPQRSAAAYRRLDFPPECRIVYLLLFYQL